MLRNTRDRWGSASKCLHWLIVVLITIEVPAGFLMAYTFGLSMRDQRDGLPLHTLAGQIHHTIGFSILLLAAARLMWRVSGAIPQGEPREPATAARIVHAALYLLLIAVPVSGWAALSAYGAAPIWIFDRSDLAPSILPQRQLSDPYGYGFFAKTHVRLLIVGASLLSVHAAAALWHHFIRRDNVLRRMWPLAALKHQQAP